MLSADRAAIAAALSAVPGMKGYAKQPNVPRAGQGWPLWAGIDRAEYDVNTWRVVVVTGGTSVQAETYLDAHLDDLLAALRSVIFVDQVTPFEIVVDQSSALHAIEVRGRREF